MSIEAQLQNHEIVTIAMNDLKRQAGHKWALQTESMIYILNGNSQDYSSICSTFPRRVTSSNQTGNVVYPPLITDSLN